MKYLIYILLLLPVITFGQVQYNGEVRLVPKTGTYTQGKLIYDQDNQSLTFYNNDNNVSMQVGQEEWIRVINKTGSTIANGAAIYINGSDATSGLHTIALAQSNSGTTTVGMGLTTESITNNSIGVVTVIGVVHGLNTSAFTAGLAVYIDPTTPGALTQTVPTAPNFVYRVGIVGVQSATVGTIHVTPSTATLGRGTANQYYAVNTAGTAHEYKTISGTAPVTVTHATGTTTVSLAAGNGTEYFTTAGGTTAYTLTPTVALSAYAAGNSYKIRMNATNTGASTLAVSGLAAITLVKGAATAVAAGDLLINRVYDIVYDGTNFQVQDYGGTPTGSGGLVQAISPTFTGTPVLPGTFTMAANSFIRSGAHNLTLTTGATTNVTLPASGTLATLAGTENFSGKTITDKLRGTVAANTGFGTAVLVGGTVTVSNTSVTASSIILLTSQVDGGSVGFQRVSARSAGVSFTITSSSASDTSTIGFVIIN